MNHPSYTRGRHDKTLLAEQVDNCARALLDQDAN
jgi:hypothetical protein